MKWSRSVVSDSLRLHGLQPTRLLCPWDLPGKRTGVGCHGLLSLYIYIYMCVCVCVCVCVYIHIHIHKWQCQVVSFKFLVIPKGVLQEFRRKLRGYALLWSGEKDTSSGRGWDMAWALTDGKWTGYLRWMNIIRFLWQLFGKDVMNIHKSTLNIEWQNMARD